MKSKKNRFILWRIIIVLAMLVVWRLMYAKLPAVIPTHWNIRWEVDGYGSKIWTVLIIPWLCILLLVLFYFLPKIDPKKERYKEFATAREWIQSIIVVFFAYIYAVIFYITLHPWVSINSFMFWGFGALFIVLWLAMKHVKSNYFVGIKTPWTLANETVWNKTHALWTRTFSIAWALCILDAFVWVAMFRVLMSSIILGALIPVIYSYFIYQKIVK